MASKLKTYIFGGPSGCGKGTQVDLLKAYLQKKTPDTPQFSAYTGDGFRALVKGDTLTSSIARDILDKGGLQPEFLAVWLWSELFIKNFKGNEHVIIDGSPRRLGEAYAIDSAIRFYNREEPTIIVINVSNEAITKRLLARGRKDDTAEAIARRLEWYQELVLPAFEYLKAQPGYRLVEINGEQSPEDVHKDILKALSI